MDPLVVKAVQGLRTGQKQEGARDWSSVRLRSVCRDREKEWKPLPLSTEGSVSATLPRDLLRNLSHIKFLLAGLVKAVNTAVDLIVAHFGTSRDPGVKVGKKLKS